jgi:hypothetical protein
MKRISSLFEKKHSIPSEKVGFRILIGFAIQQWNKISSLTTARTKDVICSLGFCRKRKVQLKKILWTFLEVLLQMENFSLHCIL